MFKTINDFADRQDLIDQVIKQLAVDVKNKDFTAIEQLLMATPVSYLIDYLPEE